MSESFLVRLNRQSDERELAESTPLGAPDDNVSDVPEDDGRTVTAHVVEYRVHQFRILMACPVPIQSRDVVEIRVTEPLIRLQGRSGGFILPVRPHEGGVDGNVGNLYMLRNRVPLHRDCDYSFECQSPKVKVIQAIRILQIPHNLVDYAVFVSTTIPRFRVNATCPVRSPFYWDVIL